MRTRIPGRLLKSRKPRNQQTILEEEEEEQCTSTSCGGKKKLKKHECGRQDLHCPFEDKHVLPGIFHQVFAQPVDEEADVGGLVCVGGVGGWQGDFVRSLRGEEEL